MLPTWQRVDEKLFRHFFVYSVPNFIKTEDRKGRPSLAINYYKTFSLKLLILFFFEKLRTVVAAGRSGVQ